VEQSETPISKNERPHWWFMPVIPGILEVGTRGSRFEAGPGEVSVRPYLKNKSKAKGLGA
jgi:hypothetical protein